MAHHGRGAAVGGLLVVLLAGGAARGAPALAGLWAVPRAAGSSGLAQASAALSNKLTASCTKLQSTVTVTVSWDARSDTTYTLSRAVNSGAPTPVGSTYTNGTHDSYADTDLTKSTTYTYTVTGRLGTLGSAQSATVTLSGSSGTC